MEYVIEPEPFVKALHDHIIRANLEWELNRPWTNTIKAGLKTILQRDLTEVIFTDSQNNVSEFLLDIVAWDRKEGEGIVVAVECEWTSTPAELVKDFEKLLVVKSPVKVMIFASYGRATGRQGVLIEALMKSFLSYKHHMVGERYIFIDFAKPPERKAFWFEVKSEGKLSSVGEIHDIDMAAQGRG